MAKLTTLHLDGNPMSKIDFQRIGGKGFEDFMGRRSKSRQKDASLGALDGADVCGLL